MAGEAYADNCIDFSTRSVQELDLIEMIVLRSSSNLVHSIRR